MMDYSRIVEAAAHLAQRLHKGHVDKAGKDYFEGHLTSVAKMGKGWKEQLVGYLHDASEDTPHTVEDVLNMLEHELGADLPSKAELSEALTLLNCHNVPDRESYIHAIATNQLATAVKLNDLTNNMDLTRISSPTPKDMERLERYKREYAYLKLDR